uniref:AAA+ ATPase domain-containing protein n=1 Tax=Tolypothrix bouteillei VB521301 TaxID=1479485 RepID=A0A0C1RNF2_9CYAN
MKNFAINIGLMSGTIAVTNQLLSKYYEYNAKIRIDTVLETAKGKIGTLETTVSEKTNLLVEIEKLYEVRKQELDTTKSSLDSANNAIAALSQKLRETERSIDEKKRELDEKISREDIRLNEYLQQFRSDFVIEFCEWLIDSHKRLEANIISRINHEHTIEKAKEKLEKLLQNAREQHQEHLNKVNNIVSSERPQDMLDSILDIHSEVIEQVIALRVRYRNLLNLDERLQLNVCLEKLGEVRQQYVPRTKAIDELNQMAESSRASLERIYNRVDENESDLNELNRQVSDLLAQIEEKNLLIAELKQPIRWCVATRDDLRIGNGIIAYFEQLGLILDRAYSEYRKHEAVLYFHTDRNKRTILVGELNDHKERLQQLLHTLSPVVWEYDGTQGLMKCLVQIANTPTPPKEDVTKSIPHCIELVKHSKRGFLVSGHPGSGKSSSMKAIACWLGDKNSMRLSLNPHQDEHNTFVDAGFVELNDLPTIYDAILALNTELLYRAEDPKRRQLLIVIVDELGRLLLDAPKDLDVMEVLRQAAVEGRKMNVIVLIGNHSQTTSAIDMDSEFRSAFYQLFLVGAARHKLNMPNAPKLKPSDENFISTAPYPVLVSINGKFEVCQHPTHSVYREYRDSGLPPIGIEKLSPNDVKIGDKTFAATPTNHKRCPNCGSERTVSKGRGRKRTCNDCGHRF